MRVRVSTLLLLIPLSCNAFLSVPTRINVVRTSTTSRSLNNFFNFNSNEEKEAEVKEDEKQYEDGAYDEDDPVEKIFGFFFGKREEKPMGMCKLCCPRLKSLLFPFSLWSANRIARFGPDRFPEQYPATKTEWADPVASDNKEMAKLRPLLKNTNLETRGLKLSYSASKNGWNADAFHRAVDKKGGGLVVCTTQSGQVCGGYNPKGWVGYGEARSSIAAFLFVFNPDGSATKLQKVGGKALAQMDMPEAGPSFGADSLVIPLDKNNPKQARSKLGSYYERFADGTNTLFQTTSSTQLKDLKVYHGVYGKDEFIPFTDAEPFALY